MYCFYLKSPTAGQNHEGFGAAAAFPTPSLGTFPVSGSECPTTGTWTSADQDDPTPSDSSSMPDSAALPVCVTGESLMGDWVDSDGSAVQVQRADGSSSRLHAVVSRTMQPSVVLDLEQDSESSGWHCGDATLQYASNSSMQLTWRFQDGRTWQWMKGASMWQCYSHGGIDQSCQHGIDDFCHGPYVQEDGSVSLNDLAWYLSGGTAATMMMPVFSSAPEK